MKFYRILFILAGLYNLAFGIWLFISPVSLFGTFGLPVLMPPVLYQALAVMIAAFAFAYFYSAFHLLISHRIILIGLLSKIAPILMMTIVQYFIGFDLKWYLLIFFNDLIWWIPFVMYLRHPVFRK